MDTEPDNDLRYGAYPVQLEGLTPSGAPFYFHARHGAWHLWTGPKLADPDYLTWCEHEQLAGHGDDPTGGIMPPADVDRLITDHLGPGWIGTSNIHRQSTNHAAETRPR